MRRDYFLVERRSMGMERTKISKIETTQTEEKKE